MEIVETTTENHMIACFLKAEANSSRWKERVLSTIKRLGQSKQIIDNPDLDDEAENRTRKKILTDVRGYGNNDLLFSTFPSDTKWYLAKIKKEELGRVKYMKYSYWDELSKHTRLVESGAQTIKDGTEIFNERNEGFLQAAEAVRKGTVFPPLILVGTDDHSGLVVLEGHQRITAYQIAIEYMPEVLEVIIGLSPNMSLWDSY